MLFVIGHGLTAYSYIRIPAHLWRIHRVLPPGVDEVLGGAVASLLRLFGVFILACAIGHILESGSIWVPAYWLVGAWHVATGVISLKTERVLAGAAGPLRQHLGMAAGLRFPFEEAFEGSAAGLAVVSAGNVRGDVIWGWGGANTEGRWLRVNPALSEMLGYAPEVMQGMTFHDITVRSLDADLERFAKVRSGESDRYRVQKSYRRSDGTELPALLAVAVVRDLDGVTPLYYVSQIIDRTEEVRTQDLLQGALEVTRRERDALVSAMGDSGEQGKARLQDAIRALDATMERLGDDTT